MSKTLPQFGLTMGDPNGIGPEIIIRSLQNLKPWKNWQPMIFGDLDVLLEVNTLLKNPLQFYNIKNTSSSNEYAVPVLDLAIQDSRQWEPGKLCAWGGESAYTFVTEAIQWASKDQIAAIVTAPLCKESLHAAGHIFPGHTEILSHHTSKAPPIMMLAVDGLKAIHVTLHMALKDAIASLTTERIVEVMCIGNTALQQMGIKKPRLGIPGLNPHAGENGLFGNEEKEIIIPAIEKARSLGIECNGPISPDVVFLRHRDGEFDAVITLYHDQAHIAFKLLGFERGVNITLGLPIIRTSVDHGTAFDRAAKFQSDPTSMIEAIHFARKMVSQNSEKNQ